MRDEVTSMVSVGTMGRTMTNFGDIGKLRKKKVLVAGMNGSGVKLEGCLCAGKMLQLST